ncbi:uncharacterized protein ALTATR162_LOCUS11368 [Alternaria atra]|uniref:Uncharacterized protein n=1 Tax=Alternaria atra TaxID=119953 RepID=A0A8J2ICP8_9PLEO|nr:uncharacterized protein ALTATR162_LOCUS11368 [Alternaria atra]CAG5185667.1 unnamed protein product [Alternaria atra]
MRLLTLFMMLLPAVVGLTLNKTDGTTIELGDQPTVIDLRNVIMPARASVTESNIHSNPDVADVNIANWDRLASNLHFHDHINYQGNVMTSYRCIDGINSCMTLLNNDPIPFGASSITFKDCPDGAPNHGRKFHCFFFRTGACEATARSLYLRGSVANLANIGWNDKIKSVECYWD